MESVQWSDVFLFIGPALINFALFVYVVLALPATRVNRLFAIFVFLLGVEQVADLMMHTASTYEMAQKWQHAALGPWVFIAAIGVLLVTNLTHPTKMTRRAWLYPALLVPAMLCQFMIAGNLDKSDIIKDPVWGWVANPVADGPTIVIFLFICVVALLMPVILWTAFVRNRHKPQFRNQFLLLAIGVSVPYIGGVIAEVVLPMSFGIDGVPVAGPLMTTFTICAGIAIRKYRMLDYSPRHQFDRILDTMTESILIADQQGKIMYSNSALCRLLDYSCDELAGSDVSILTRSDENGMMKNANGSAEMQLICKDGDPIWTLINTSPCLDARGKEIGTVFTITNIDVLKKSGLMISKNEQRLNRAQEVAHVGSWELSFATGKTTWSQEACRIYGFSTTDNIHSFETWVSLIHPADLATVMLEVKKTQDVGSDGDFEHRIVRRDGTTRYIQSVCKFEYGNDGEPVGLFGICKDITHIKAAEEKIRSTSRELETYIYKSSHDMHAPLASILGLINVSRMEVFDPIAVRYFQMVESQAKKLDSVRAEFIKAMHIKDATKLDEEVHLNAIIGDILKNLRASEGFSRLNINVNVDPGKKLVSNEFLMRTILQNLIENSIKYQDYNQEKSTLVIDLQQADDTTNITIEDNGVGIDPSIHDRIFDMYFKTTESRQGSGLGLYLVKKAVEKLDGKLQLRSSPGYGTKVTLSFVQAS